MDAPGFVRWMLDWMESLEDGSAPQACRVQFLRRFLRMKAVCFCGADQEALVDMIKAIMSLGQTESISKLLLFIKLFRVFYLSPRRLCFLLWFFVWFDIGIKK